MTSLKKLQQSLKLSLTDLHLTVNMEDTLLPESRADFLEHCLFCLRQCDYPINGGLSSFEHLWLYVARGKWMDCEDYQFRKFGNVGEEEGTVRKYSKVPPMCAPCSEVISELNDLHGQIVKLRKEIGKRKIRIRKIFTDSKDRVLEFEKLLKTSSVDKELISSTKKLMRILRGRITQPEDDAFIRQSPLKVAKTPESSRIASNFQSSISSCLDDDEMDSDLDVKPKSEDEGEIHMPYKIYPTPIQLNTTTSSSGGGRRKQSLQIVREELPPEPLRKEENSSNDGETGETTDSADDPLAETFSHPFQIKRKRRLKKRKPNQVSSSHLCDICHERVLRDEMFEHLSTHVTPEYINKCPTLNCPRLFVTWSCLKRHWKEVCWKKAVSNSTSQIEDTLDIERKCETCEFEASSGLAFRIHLERHETLTKNFECPISTCKEKFTVRQSVQLHLNKHIYKAPVDDQKCPLCWQKFPFDKMAEHLKNTHSVEDICKCVCCPFVFSDRTFLLDHMKLHVDDGISCDICNDGVKYAKLCYLREHYFTAHKVGEKLLCEHCNAEFTTLHSLKYHRQIQHTDSGKASSKEKKVFKCDICFGDVEFRGEDQLLTHKIEVHGEEPLACNTCQETFSCRTKLRRHQHSHKGITVSRMEFTCDRDQCSRVFKNKSKLLDHIKLSHSEGPPERDNVCDVCGKTFFLRRQLLSHKVRHKQEDFMHVCDTCGKNFASSTSFIRHKRIHTGERPFSCDFCGQRFRQRETWHTHVASHKSKGDKFCPKGPMERGVRKGRKNSNSK